MTWPKTAITFPSFLIGMRWTTIFWPWMSWEWLISAWPVSATMCMRLFSTDSVQWRPIWVAGSHPRNCP